VSRRPAARASAAALAAVALAAAASGCGTPPPDLFVMKRDGTVPGARLELLVSDQTARCNDGPVKDLTSDQILEARDIRRDLIDVQAGMVDVPTPPPAQIFTFAVTTEQGTLRYTDTTQRPAILPRLSRFTRRVAIDTCGLER
jgi:hypothetical protein